MGLNKAYLGFIESSIQKVFDASISGLQMLELGDQVVIGDKESIPEETGKEYFTNRGYSHTSVDINGQHGALVRDLSKPEQFSEWHNSCDILSNAGTSEHVEPYTAQYECFNIIHDCLKVGGVAIHLVPDIFERDGRNAWKDHCQYFYSQAFFESLAKDCEYELLDNQLINGLRCVAVRKTKNIPFMSDRSKFLSLITQRKYTLKRHVISLLSEIGVGKWLRKLGLRK
jgi:hypothetical protein